jgi:hypothetical protein
MPGAAVRVILAQGQLSLYYCRPYSGSVIVILLNLYLHKVL